MSDLPAPIANVIETFNADIREAAKDGLDRNLKIALMGAIVEAVLTTIEGLEARRGAYNAMRYGIERRFNDGRL